MNTVESPVFLCYVLYLKVVSVANDNGNDVEYCQDPRLTDLAPLPHDRKWEILPYFSTPNQKPPVSVSTIFHFSLHNIKSTFTYLWITILISLYFINISNRVSWLTLHYSKAPSNNLPKSLKHHQSRFHADLHYLHRSICPRNDGFPATWRTRLLQLYVTKTLFPPFSINYKLQHKLYGSRPSLLPQNAPFAIIQLLSPSQKSVTGILRCLET